MASLDINVGVIGSRVIQQTNASLQHHHNSASRKEFAGQDNLMSFPCVWLSPTCDFSWMNHTKLLDNEAVDVVHTDQAFWVTDHGKG